MRAIWTGAISFGLVNIPVKLYSAVEESDPELDMLDKKDHANIHFKRINAITGKEVEWKNIVRGFKVNGRYVVLDEEDLKNISPAKTQLINITDFANSTEISPIYYETPYFLEPQKSGVRAYALLREALKKTGKVGVATFVFRNKEHLVIIQPLNKTIVLNRIRFSEEIRDESELHLPAKGIIKPAEMKMAISLIKQLSGKFNIKKYKDTFHADLMKMIKAKSKGARIAPAKLKVAYRAGGLMAQLKSSLNHPKRKAS